MSENHEASFGFPAVSGIVGVFAFNYEASRTRIYAITSRVIVPYRTVARADGRRPHVRHVASSP
eukprot:scaffold652336_cov30-Prasinocladus_malaysianus.AAC.1